MPHLDARAIARVAQNPRCQRQSAMLLLGLRDEQAFALLTGQPYHGPRGERAAALRWGALFDSRLTERQATRLLASLDGVLGITPATATVRDLRREVPDSRPAALGERNRRTRAILSDLLASRPVPDVLIQPPLHLRWGPRDWGFIVPDALVLDRERGVYLPLEAKGHVSVDGVVAAGDRARPRLQAAVQSVALSAELARIDVRRDGGVHTRALLIVATPFGFTPAPAILEDLAAEIAAVAAALHTMAQTQARLAVLEPTHSLPEALPYLRTHYQEGCLTNCAMADVCRTRARGVRGELGDRADSLMGKEIDQARVVALISGDPPLNEGETVLLASLRDTAAVFHLGWS